MQRRTWQIAVALVVSAVVNVAVICLPSVLLRGWFSLDAHAVIFIALATLILLAASSRRRSCFECSLVMTFSQYAASSKRALAK